MIQVSEHNLRRFVEKLASRSALSESDKAAILALPTKVRAVSRNHDVVRLGERVDHACFVAEGLLGHFDQNSMGSRQFSALYIPGDMPDLQSVVQPTATIGLHALSKATIIQVPHTALRTVTAAHPAIAEAFWRHCTVDAMILAQWVVNVGRRDARTRIAHLMCEMACRSGAVSAGGEVVFEFRITQAQLADALGITAVHTNRSLMALNAEGLETGHGKVRIADWDEFVKIAEFDSTYLQVDVSLKERIKACS